MKPALTEEKLDERVLRDFRKENNKQFKNSLNKLLPQKLIQPIINKIDMVSEKEIVNEINNTEEEITEENIVVESKIEEQKTQEEADIPEKEKESQQELQKQITIATQDKKVESPKQAEQSKVTQVITKQKTEINEQLKQDIKTETQIQEQTKFETKVEEKQSETPKCTDTNHGVGVGNSNKWFNSYNEAVSYYDNLILSYSNKVHNGEIIFEEYNKQCPCGVNSTVSRFRQELYNI